jgi:hypothetical protein
MPRLDIDALKSLFETGDKPTGGDYVNLIDTLIQQSTDLGTAGNNEHEITGIENSTVIDQINTNEWRMVKYLVSISKTDSGSNKFYATEISVLIDSSGVNVAEYGVIDNDGDMGTISVSRQGDVLQLVLIPNPSVRPVTVRYARMGLKA